MKKLLISAIILTMAASVIAADIPQTGQDKMVEQRATAPEAFAPVTLSPFQLEIESLMAAEKADIQVLETEFANAVSEERALQILKQIEQRKLETELSLLEYQKNEAEKLGNTELVNKISACMEKTRSPRPAGTPQNRPAPTER